MKKILIIEDIGLNLDLLVQILEDDYQLLTAGDGLTGIELAARERPDLILMDLSLPRLDGWEATRRLKSGELKDIPIIVITAHAMVGEEERARECGCDDFMTKPISIDVLLDKVEGFLGPPDDAPPA
ncbi:MAG: response regulator [Myxococcales bacterium]|nr:response regulator [Myxococcales bacterium]